MNYIVASTWRGCELTLNLFTNAVDALKKVEEVGLLEGFRKALEGENPEEYVSEFLSWRREVKLDMWDCDLCIKVIKPTVIIEEVDGTISSVSSNVNTQVFFNREPDDFCEPNTKLNGNPTQLDCWEAAVNVSEKEIQLYTDAFKQVR